MSEWEQDPTFKIGNDDHGWEQDPTFKKPESRMLEAGIEGLGQGASLGYGNELAAALEQVTFPIASFLTGQDVQADPYLEARDKYEARTKQLQKENPGSYMAGNIGGALASGIATAPLTAVKGATGLAKLGNAARIGALQGAAMDVDNKPGEYSLGAEDRLKNAALGGVLGGVLQGGINVAENIPGALKKIANRRAVKATGLSKKDMVALQKAGKVDEMGNYLLENKAVKMGDSIDDIARKTGELEKGAGERLNSVYQRAAELFKEKSLSSGFDPLRDKSEILQAAKEELGETVGAGAAINKLSNYLDEVASRHGDAPYKAALNKYQGELADFESKQSAYLKELERYKNQVGSNIDPNQQQLPFVYDDLQRTGAAPVNIETYGKAASEMVPQPLDDFQQLQIFEMPTGNSEAQRLFSRPGDANFGHLGGDAASRVGQKTASALGESAQKQFLKDRYAKMMTNESSQGGIDGLQLTPRSYLKGEVPSIEKMSGQLELPLLPDAPMQPSLPKDIRNPMLPGDSNPVKTALDREIKYSRNPMIKDPATEKAFYGARSKIAEKIENQINDLGGGALGDELKTANKDYGFATSSKMFADDKAARDAVNRDISLTDYISGVGGASIGQIPGAIAGAALNKIGRGYGNATMADLSNRISKQLLTSPQWQNIAKTNPQVFNQFVTNLASQREKENSGYIEQDSTEQKPGASYNKDEILNKMQGTKYHQVLQNAAQKGDQSFNAAVYVLGQRDQEYRNTLKRGENQ